MLKENGSTTKSDTDDDKEEKQDYQLDRALDILHALAVMHEAVEEKPQSNQKGKK